MIELKNLTKKFDDFTAVDHLSLRIETGEFFGLLGPNGAGKTTTISMMSTVLLPTEGEIWIDGQKLDRKASAQKRKLSVITQEYSMRQDMNMDEVMEYQGRLYFLPRKVIKQRTDELLAFADRFDRVEIQVEPSLIPGNLYTMSADCDGKFAERFATEYLMVIQDDGFPLRPGLGEFLGKWDFIGAPYVRDKFLPRLAARLLNLWTSNGGFSIRSKRMCDLAAKYWREEYHAYPDCHAVGEDAYYTETLIWKRREYRRTMKFADNRSAIRFAWDAIVPFDVKELPFGFHRAKTFVEFQKRGWLTSPYRA